VAKQRGRPPAAPFLLQLRDHIAPELIIRPGEAWRIISLDELKLKLATHDDEGGTSRNCERSLEFGKDDVGESMSAQSSYSLSGLAGSHGDGTPIPAAFSFAAANIDPGWTVGAPVFTTFGGMKIEPSFFANPKGSIVPEMLMMHLKFIDKVRVHHNRPDAKVLVLMDGVQTHVTVAMLEFFAMNNLVLGLRPPNCSHLVQNEDLLSFSSSATTRTTATTK
jgi:hypothetical protein